jgi:hypothetical protein
MFDLEKQIAAWRQEMFRAGVPRRAVLDELESHLRNDIANLVSSGKSEPAAFKLAVSQLGAADPLSAEFMKKDLARKPIKFVVRLGILIFLVNTWFTTWLGKSDGSFDWLWFAHVLTFTAGYFAALLGGFLAMAAVAYRRLGRFSLEREALLIRAVKRSGLIAAVLVAVGFSLGLHWAMQHRGPRAFDSRSPRFIGAQCATIWIIGLAIWQFLNAPSQRSTICSAIFGNMVVALAWWAPVIIYAEIHASPPSYSFGAYWLPPAIILTTSAISLVLAMGPNEFKRTVES